MNSAIILNTCKEKLLRKDWIILSAVMLLLLLFFSGSNSTITVGGQELTDWAMMFPYFMIVGSLACGLSAIFMSAGAIPLEYERKNSHLVWTRGVSQPRYHFSVAVGNAFAATMAVAIFYLTCGIFTLMKNGDAIFVRLPVSFLLTLLVAITLSFLTSALSVKLPPAATTIIMAVVFVIGIMKNILNMLVSTMEGGSAAILRAAIYIWPNFSDMAAQASNFAQGRAVDIHMILGTGLMMYAGIVLLYILRRKEA